MLAGGTLVAVLAWIVASSGDVSPAGIVTINAQILDRTGIVVKLGRWIEKKREAEDKKAEEEENKADSASS